MAKLLFSIVLVALAVIIQGRPTTHDEIMSAVKAGNWDEFQRLLNQDLAPRSWKPDFNSIRNLQPLAGGQVYGEAEYTFHSSSNINGKKNQESGGHKIINDNGKVNEFDFKPTGFTAL